MAERRNGVLLIADISGYTRFVGGVELEHGTATVGDLLGVVVEQLRSIATLAKFEGDAEPTARSERSTSRCRRRRR